MPNPKSAPDFLGGPIRVAIVEDEETTREALRLLIGASPGFACDAAFGTAEAALQALPKVRPDVVPMDIQLPGIDGIECIAHLRDRLPESQIIMLTVLEDYDRIFQSLAAGGSGYLVKKTPPAKLLEAVEDVHRGGAPMSSQIARKVVDYFRQTPGSKVAERENKSSAAPPSTPEIPQLSPRQNDILRLLAQGYLYKEIADQLGISIGTVRVHIRKIYEKLHVHNRTEATRKYLGAE